MKTILAVIGFIVVAVLVSDGNLSS